MKRALLVSDIHLAPERPELESAFLGFLDGPARAAGALYILGDLFDAWLGDDDLISPAWQRIVQSLRDTAARGTQIYLQQGNRDFLIGQDFARACGLQLLPETAFATLGEQRTLLMHGDQLCLDDQAYQAWRRQARDPQWQAQFLALPLEERRAIAANLRQTSDREKVGKPPQIMDVNQAAVAAAMRAAGVRRLIHGHTHRPARHAFELDAQSCERWVLPDWRPQGGYLECTAESWITRVWPE